MFCWPFGYPNYVTQVEIIHLTLLPLSLKLSRLKGKTYKQVEIIYRFLPFVLFAAMNQPQGLPYDRPVLAVHR